MRFETIGGYQGLTSFHEGDDGPEETALKIRDTWQNRLRFGQSFGVRWNVQGGLPEGVHEGSPGKE